MSDRSVTQIIPAIETSDGAGVRLRRSLGGPRLPEHDPFLLLDAFRSDDGADYIAGFPDHPHRGFETVTYMLAGRMRHRDNQGNSGLLTAGSVQWMTAGRGIVHSEMPEQEAGLMAGFQLWVNLPASDKMCQPRYQDIPPANIPEVARADGAHVKVVAGTIDGVAGPVDGIAVEPLYLDVALPKGSRTRIPVPSSHAALLYVFEGSVEIGDADDGGASKIERDHLAVLGPGDSVPARAPLEDARYLVIAGRAIGEPVARYGPFVMNTRAELEQAVVDFQSGRF